MIAYKAVVERKKALQKTLALTSRIHMPNAYMSPCGLLGPALNISIAVHLPSAISVYRPDLNKKDSPARPVSLQRLRRGAIYKS